MGSSATVIDFLAAALEHDPDAVLFRHADGAQLSYGLTAQRVVATAIRLTDLGVGTGSYVVTHVQDTIQLATVDLACALVGAAAAPVSPIFTPAYVAGVCRQLGTRWVVTTPDGAGVAVGAGLEALCFGSTTTPAHELPLDAEVPFEIARAQIAGAAGRIAADGLFVVQPTSGSTGEPKLVLRTHRAFARYAYYLGRELREVPGPTSFLAANGFTHAFGLHVFAIALSLGAELRVPSALEAAVPLHEVRELDPRVVPTTPRVLRALHRQAQALEGMTAAAQLFGPSARVVCSAGGRADDQLLNAIQETGIDVIEWYGSSEASLVSLTRRGAWRPGWSGQVVDDAAVRTAADGELLVRSPGVALGYYGEPALTDAVISADGFYRTGDLGEVSDDRCLRILGRARDVMNTPEGSNIYPERIEIMIEACPGVDQTMLIGDGRPFMTAFVVVGSELQPVVDRVHAGATDGVIAVGAAPNLYARFAPILDDVNGRLQPIERIRRFVLLGTRLPTTVLSSAGAGKVRRNRPAFLDLYGARVEEIYDQESGPIGWTLDNAMSGGRQAAGRERQPEDSASVRSN